ncbi:hypothetical protein [Paenibacillus antarcticus]|nr:hypothetical protein [Paenibacillus antarcticus]
MISRHKIERSEYFNETVIAQPTIVGNYEATDMDAIAKLEEEQG